MKPLELTIKHVIIPTKDQSRALAFYKEKLGCEIVCDLPCIGSQRWIELKLPGVDTGLVLFTPPGQEDRVGSASNIIFSCKELQDVYETLVERGVQFLQPPTQEVCGTYALFKDSEENVFCISSS